jgi:hypothetical protein
MEALRREEQSARYAEDVDELESEDSYESGEDDVGARRRFEKREARIKARMLAEADRMKRMEERKALLRQKEAALLTCSDEDAEGESEDADDETLAVRFAELESPAGR